MIKFNLIVSTFLLTGLGFVANAQTSNGAINLKNMDTSVRPQDDFYNYVNGGWMKKAEIPSDRSRWGSFDELREFTDSVTLGILKKSMKESHVKGSEGQKVADLYQTITDTVSRNQQGIKPILPTLAKIDAIKNTKDLQKFLTAETPYGFNPFYGFYVYNHKKKSTENAIYLGSASLGMGKDYYQKEDAESKAKLEKYTTFVAKMLAYTDDAQKEQHAKEIVTFEKSMAKSMFTLEEERDDNLQYNPMAVKDLKKIVKNVNLASYLKNVGVKTDSVIISEINYYKKLDQFINKSNLETVKRYLKATVINDNLGYLSMDMERMNFDFYSRQLQGVQQQRSLDKRALGIVNGTVGEALGKLYVKEVFPAEAKTKAQEMINYLKLSYKEHIEGLTWMSADTKTKAVDKLNKIMVKIGYPDQWKDYSTLSINNTKEGGSYYQNMKNAAHWDFQRELAKIGKPVDKTEWHMNPQTVNAYYNPQNNEIVFPAAILQPPFYNYKADAAVNFGGIGAVIGHEISHGFDDSGADYDGDGNLKNWWTEQDAEKFEAAGQALADQFSAYEPFPSIHVNGKFTLGENIGDLGGINTAYTALQLYLRDHSENQQIDGFTQNQRFFMSWATIWRTKIKDEALKNQVKTDPHSPGYYRAIGPLENVDAFYKAFNVKEGDKMYKAPTKRIIIW